MGIIVIICMHCLFSASVLPWLSRGYTFTPIMENQMEKNIENDMETGIIYRRYVGLILCYNLHSLIMGCT